jgi:hypothetical protein
MCRRALVAPAMGPSPQGRRAGTWAEGGQRSELKRGVVRPKSRLGKQDASCDCGRGPARLGHQIFANLHHRALFDED